MRTTILNRLKAIEKEYDIKVLYACESGSRGWEFPSPDSDYDVRFIYTKPYLKYLSVTAMEDHLDFPLSDELDLNGWDLRKTLQLICKSNTTPFEWLQSPIVYREDKKFREELWQLCSQYFGRRSNIHHYLGIAKGALETRNAEGNIKIKKLFYVLRPLLAAKWCFEKNAIAPMSIQPLMNLMPEKLQQKVTALIALKATMPEGYAVKTDEVLQSWISETYSLCSEASAALDKDHFETEALDQFFRKTIQDHDYTGYKG